MKNERAKGLRRVFEGRKRTKRFTFRQKKRSQTVTRKNPSRADQIRIFFLDVTEPTQSRSCMYPMKKEKKITRRGRGRGGVGVGLCIKTECSRSNSHLPKSLLFPKLFQTPRSKIWHFYSPSIRNVPPSPPPCRYHWKPNKNLAPPRCLEFKFVSGKVTHKKKVSPK